MHWLIIFAKTKGEEIHTEPLSFSLTWDQKQDPHSIRYGSRPEPENIMHTIYTQTYMYPEVNVIC